MVLNSEKCNYMTFPSKITKSEFTLEDGTTAPPAEEHMLLEITINSRLVFYSI